MVSPMKMKMVIMIIIIKFLPSVYFIFFPFKKSRLFFTKIIYIKRYCCDDNEIKFVILLSF
jgi:hypothetical protein